MGTESKFAPPGLASVTAAITGTGRAFAMNDCRRVSWQTIYTGTAPGAGVLVIEYASSIDYAGTWSTLDTVTLTGLATGVDGFGSIDGVISFIRARFTTNSDQPVTVYINGLVH